MNKYNDGDTVWVYEEGINKCVPLKVSRSFPCDGEVSRGWLYTLGVPGWKSGYAHLSESFIFGSLEECKEYGLLQTEFLRKLLKDASFEQKRRAAVMTVKEMCLKECFWDDEIVCDKCCAVEGHPCGCFVEEDLIAYKAEDLVAKAEKEHVERTLRLRGQVV